MKMGGRSLDERAYPDSYLHRASDTPITPYGVAMIDFGSRCRG